MAIKKFVPNIGFRIPFLYRRVHGVGHGFGSYYYLFPFNILVRFVRYAKEAKKKINRG